MFIENVFLNTHHKTYQTFPKVFFETVLQMQEYSFSHSLGIHYISAAQNSEKKPSTTKSLKQELHYRSIKVFLMICSYNNTLIS